MIKVETLTGIRAGGMFLRELDVYSATLSGKIKKPCTAKRIDVWCCSLMSAKNFFEAQARGA